MVKTFRCASCGAPLDFTGEVIQKCGHCGGSVIAPHDLFYANNASPFADVAARSQRSRILAQIQNLIRRGGHAQAVKLYSESFGVTAEAAEAAISRIERGESLDVTGISVTPVQLKVSKNAVRKAGWVLTAFVVATVALPLVFVIGGFALAFFLSEPADGLDSPAGAETPSGQSPLSQTGQASPATELLKIGGKGNGSGLFSDNRHVAVDRTGRIFSSDYSPMNVQVFDAQGKFLTEWKPAGGNHLYDLAADANDGIFVATSRGIFKHNAMTGTLMAKAENADVRALTLLRDRRIAICDRRTISFYDNSLKLLSRIANAAELASAVHGFQKITADGSGNLLLLDRNAKEIVRFSPEGKLLNRFPHGAGSVNDIAVSPKGDIYIVETSKIHVLDSTGNKLTEFRTTQAFGIDFTTEGELVVATRPYVTKYSVSY